MLSKDDPLLNFALLDTFSHSFPLAQRIEGEGTHANWILGIEFFQYLYPCEDIHIHVAANTL